MKKSIGSGVTLIELTIAMSILLVIGYLILSSTLSSRTTSAIAQATIFINAQAFQAGSSITKDLMEAEATSVITDDSFVDSDNITKYRNISFMVPVLDTNGALVLDQDGNVEYGDGTTQGNYIRYRLVNTSLEREILASDGTTILSAKTIAQCLLNTNGFKTTANSGLGYNMTLSFLINVYQGINLPSPLTLTSNITGTPQN